MYEHHFELRDKPFKLVPDPKYLYLSPSHANALSKLSEALEHGDGFALIVGEAGTGKTTLCRYFLNGLDDAASFAYIFNTQLEGAQLLAAICHEFGILPLASADGQPSGFKQRLPVLGQGVDLRVLIQTLNDFLIDQYRSGRKVVLLIDEAQNLTSETLEMVRLLSNLETTRHKLLHIILVGQPELAEKSSTYPMRQIAQRISSHCRLSRLTARQTRAFIDHRIRVALIENRRVFSPHAVKIIHRFSQGIPRKINVAAHRCLLLAYYEKKTTVDSGLARRAVRDLLSIDQSPRQLNLVQTTVGLFALLSVCFVGAMIILSNFGQTAFSKPYTHSVGGLSVSRDRPSYARQSDQQFFKVPDYLGVEADAEPDVDAEGGAAVETKFRAVVTARRLETPVLKPLAAIAPVNEPSLSERIDALPPERSREKALAHLLSLWDQPSPNFSQFPDTLDNDRFFLVIALHYGLRFLTVTDNWALVRKLNLPAILSLGPTAQGRSLFAVLTGWKNNDVRLFINDHDIGWIDSEQMLELAGKKIIIFWQNVLTDNAVMSRKSQGDSITQVKRMLGKIGYYHLPASRFIDPPTHQAIVDFQLSQRIEADGLIGPITKILLFQSAKALDMPQLQNRHPKITDGSGT